MPESLLPLAHAQWGKQRRRRRRCCPSVGTKKKMPALQIQFRSISAKYCVKKKTALSVLPNTTWPRVNGTCEVTVSWVPLQRAFALRRRFMTILMVAHA